MWKPRAALAAFLTTLLVGCTPGLGGPDVSDEQMHSDLAEACRFEFQLLAQSEDYLNLKSSPHVVESFERTSDAEGLVRVRTDVSNGDHQEFPALYTCSGMNRSEGAWMSAPHLYDTTITEIDWQEPAPPWPPTRPFPHRMPQAPPGYLTQASADGVFDDAEPWEWLRYPNRVMPGASFHSESTQAQSGYCTFGFFVGHEGREQVLTAGHCGHVGSVISANPFEEIGSVEVGTLVRQDYDHHTDNVDIAVIDIEDDRLIDSHELPFAEPLLGVKDAVWVGEHRPRLCRLGRTSGVSCGEYLGMTPGGQILAHLEAEGGDSGGPVVAVTDEGLWAVGLTAAEHNHRRETTVTPIAEWMEEWDLTLLGTR